MIKLAVFCLQTNPRSLKMEAFTRLINHYLLIEKRARKINEGKNMIPRGETLLGDTQVCMVLILQTGPLNFHLSDNIKTIIL